MVTPLLMLVNCLSNGLIEIVVFLLYDVFENLCVARCRHDWRLRTSLAKEIEGRCRVSENYQTFRPQSRAFISGRSTTDEGPRFLCPWN